MRGSEGQGVMTTVALVLAVFFAGGYALASTLLAWRFSRRPIVASVIGEPISLLKPLYGAEPGLAENLRSFADQNYPEYQLVLGVRDRTDSALPVARALIEARPQTEIALVIDPRTGGSNLKVCNLENMMPAARHDVIVVADSDMRVGPDYLAAVTAPLGNLKTGVVTCLYKGVAGAGLWSHLSALYINFGFLPSAVTGEAIGVGGGCFGATIALRREVLERVGGFSRLRNELADDHRLGAAVRRLGLETVLSPYIVANYVTEPGFLDLWRHELRWARTSRAMAPLGFAGSIITHTVPLIALAAAVDGTWVGWSIALAALVLRLVSAGRMARWLDLPRRGLWLLPLRDAISFAVFLVSFCGRNVSWRDQVFRVEPSGRMSFEGDNSV